MKRTSKRILALLLCLALSLSLLPTAALALEDREAEPQSGGPVSGHLPEQHVGGRAVTNAYLRGQGEQTQGLNPSQPAGELPSSYDSRNYNRIPTAVRNQNPYGTCWAHGALASVEADMITRGTMDGATHAAANTSINLSEYHLAWFNYTYAYDSLGMLTGDRSENLQDTFLDGGGNGEMSTYTLMKWTGAASESTSELAYSNASTSGLDSKYAYDYNTVHVQSVEWIPTENRDAVKQAIMDHGAGTISYYHSDSYLQNGNYCFNQRYEYGSDNYQYPNHDVTVVGWDDNYSKSNFKSSYGPTSNGAWIVRNSWGSSWGKSGYFYLSYEDSASLNSYCYFYTTDSTDNYDNNYQYDGSTNLVNYAKLHNEVQVANVFTAKGAEALQAVAFCNWDEAVDYTLRIYKNPTSVKDPTTGVLAHSQTGSLTFSGYYTIPLTSSVSLAAGDKYAVVFTLSTPEADEEGYYVHMPYDASYYDTNVVPWARWTHADHGDTSFYKEVDGAWTDTPDSGDWRIKAYTDDLLFAVSAVSNNEAWGTVSVNGTKITAVPAEGYYVADAEVLSGSAECSINVNLISVAPASDCVIRVIFAPKPSYTLHFQVSGSDGGSQSALIYDQIQLPDSISIDPEGWSFVGWTAVQLQEETSAEPEFYAPGAPYTVTGDAVLYALFCRIEGSDELIYELVSGELEDWSGNFVISSGKDSSMLVLKGLSTDTRYESTSAGGSIKFANTGMSLDSGVLRDVASDYVFTLAPTGSTYSIRSVKTGTYVGTKDTYLHNLLSYAASTGDWNVTYDSYQTCMKISNVDSTQYTYLVQGSYGYFVVNNVYTTNKTQLWKETHDSTSFYITEPVAGEHTHALEAVAAMAPNCGAAGSIAHFRCTICGKLFADAEAQTELSAEDIVLPATGAHSFGAFVPNNDGSHKRVCAVCGLEETEACQYEDLVTPPTAGDQGYTTHSCIVCGYSFVDSYTSPLGFDYSVSFSVPVGVEKPEAMISNSNTGITLPSVEAPEGYSFLGWVTEAYEDVPDKPAEILTGTYVAPSDITLRALFTYTVEGTGEKSFVLVTEAPADWEGRYVISSAKTSSLYAMKGLASGKSYETASNGGAAAFSKTGFALEDDALQNVSEDYVFALRPVEGGFSIQNAAQGTYVKIASSTLQADSSFTASSCTYTLSAGSNGAFVPKVLSGGSYPYVAFSSYSNKFWCNSSSSGVFLWRETDSGTPYYTTKIGEELPVDPPADPYLLEDLDIRSMISLGSDLVIVYRVVNDSAFKAHGFDSFWFEFVRHNLDGTDTVTTYGEGKDEALIANGSRSFDLKNSSIPAAEMAVGYTVSFHGLKDGEEYYSAPVEGSLKDYFVSQLESIQPEDNNGEARLRLAADILLYGSKAQAVFLSEAEASDKDAERGSVRGAGLLDDLSELAQERLNAYGSFGTPEAVNSISYSDDGLVNPIIRLSLQYRLEITVRYTNKNASNVVVEYWPEGSSEKRTAPAALKSSTWTASIGDIGVAGVRDLYHFRVLADGVPVTNEAIWSVESYIAANRDSAEAPMQALYNAILNYGDSAAALFE